MMNPFKAVNELVDRYIDPYEKGWTIFYNAVCWIVIYFVGWLVFGYLGPYLLMLFLPIVIVPLLLGNMLWFSFMLVQKEPKSQPKLLHLFWLVPVILSIFTLMNGIPGVFFGVFFDFIEHGPTNAAYFKAIEYWWHCFNFINPFADNEIPYAFYQFSYTAAQMVFILGLFVVGYLVFSSYYEHNQEQIKEWDEHLEGIELEKEREEGERQSRRLEAAHAHAEEQERLKLEEDKRKREKEKEATDDGVWDSGFLG